MPKISNTRARRAAAVIEKLNRGPSFSLTFFHGVELTPAARALIEAEMASQFRAWSSSWIIPELAGTPTALIPELKSK